jgi:hypothetical protein
MSKSRRTVPITYRNMPIRKTAYQREVELIEVHARDRFTATVLAIGILFLIVWVVGF